MKRVVERCPNCGVEHDNPTGGACEVCGTTLRFWCRLHGAQVGWLDAPECPRCEAEASAPPPPAPRAAPPKRAPVRPREGRVPVDRPSPTWPDRTVPAGRDLREILPRGAEEWRPHVAAGANVAMRLVRAILAVLRHVVLWGLLGGVAGGAFAYSQGGDPIWTAMFGIMVGGGFGLFIGALVALRILLTRPPSPH